MEKTWMIPRRTFLRGAGVMLSLPLLNAMGKVLPRLRAAAAATSAAAEIGASARAHGVSFISRTAFGKRIGSRTEAGRITELPFALEPLERHRQRLPRLFRAWTKNTAIRATAITRRRPIF